MSKGFSEEEKKQRAWVRKRRVIIAIVASVLLAWAGFWIYAWRVGWILNSPKTEEGIYVGRLLFVQKIHSGGYDSVSHTALHFADNVFTIKGDWDFMLNATLKVTYLYHVHDDSSGHGLLVEVEKVLSVEQLP